MRSHTYLNVNLAYLFGPREDSKEEAGLCASAVGQRNQAAVSHHQLIVNGNHSFLQAGNKNGWGTTDESTSSTLIVHFVFNLLKRLEKRMEGPHKRTQLLKLKKM